MANNRTRTICRIMLRRKSPLYSFWLKPAEGERGLRLLILEKEEIANYKKIYGDKMEAFIVDGNEGSTF